MRRPLKKNRVVNFLRGSIIKKNYTEKRGYMQPSFAIIGCGKVGVMLGKHLAQAGYGPAGFFNRNIGAALYAAGIAAQGRDPEGLVFDTPWAAARQADVVFITTPDQAIEGVCKTIAKNNGFRERAIVLHCSGALPSTILSPARPCGASVGSMHPLQSFAAEHSGNPFDQIMVAVEGDGPAVETAMTIAVNLSARPFIIKTEGKIFYHAAAVAASNYLVTLMDLSFQLMAASGVPASDAFAVLKPLIQGTLENIETIGIPAALTGPIARGDIGIVEKHLAAIHQLSPELAARYARLGADTISIALAKGTLSQDAAHRLWEIFDGQKPR
jgi:predicted short-subunit dehydrogenase-like oxidoreductase (DUF2520 family)